MNSKNTFRRFPQKSKVLTKRRVCNGTGAGPAFAEESYEIPSFLFLTFH
jgi:hypothetical protein